MAGSAGTIDVDFGVVGVCDGPDFLRALNRVWDNSTDVARYEEVYLDRLAAGVRQWPVITLPGEAPVTMVTVNPGWGDGGYEVYLLEAGERAIGGEVVFIPMDASHQFEGVDEHEVL